VAKVELPPEEGEVGSHALLRGRDFLCCVQKAGHPNTTVFSANRDYEKAMAAQGYLLWWEMYMLGVFQRYSPG